MHAKIENNVVVQCPYTTDDLRKDNPQISFPAVIPDQLLLEYGVVDVFITTQPQVDHTKNVTQQSPVFNVEKNRWETSWRVTDASAEQIEQRTQDQAANVRAQRGKLLSECDWTQLDDTPVTNAKKLEWATYRQALRDVSSQPGFPFDITWPAQP